MPFLETILADEGQFPYLEWHQQRLDRTLRRHGIRNDYKLADRLKAPKSGRWRCRVLYDEHLFISEFLPYTPRKIVLLQPVEDEKVIYADKTSERGALESLFALRGKADDVVIVQKGLITDTTIANIACYLGGRWLTPAVPLLEGTARARLLAEGKLTCADISLEEALTAERIAVMNALSGFVEVSAGILPEMKKKTAAASS